VHRLYKEKFNKGGIVKEAEFIALLDKTYEGVSVPVECAVEFVGLKKMLIKLARIVAGVKPPTLETYNVVYYVKDSKLETEAAYLTPSISNATAVDEIKAAAEAEPIVG
jgi:hypothetical protein